MRFLLDVCAASRSLHQHLADNGHDVYSAAESAPRATDRELLDLALAQDRVLITEDKDFGELVFVGRLAHPCIIRFADLPLRDRPTAIDDLLQHHTEEMRSGHIIVVSKHRVRVRRGADEAS